MDWQTSRCMSLALQTSRGWDCTPPFALCAVILIKSEPPPLFWFNMQAHPAVTARAKCALVSMADKQMHAPSLADLKRVGLPCLLLYC